MDKVVERLKDEKEYYGELGRNYLSNSDIGTLLSNPSDFMKPREDNKNLSDGRYFHQLILEPERAKQTPFVEVGSRNSKEYKNFCEDRNLPFVMLKKEMEEIEWCVKKMLSNIVFYDEIYREGNKFEEPSLAMIHGVMWKGTRYRDWETLSSKLKKGIKKRLKDKLENGQETNSSPNPDAGGPNTEVDDSGATAFSKILNKITKNESYSNWRQNFIIEVGGDTYSTAAAKSPIQKRRSGNGQDKKIIDVMRGKNKIEMNPTIAEIYKDEEGGMIHNELNTMERAIKAIRKKVKKNDQQFPAWVQSKISKAADYIDTVADYMMGETEKVTEAYDDETFRQHSRETFSSHAPSESRARTASVLKKMKEINVNVEKSKKKKKKKTVAEECGCMDDKKKVLATAILKKH